MSDPWYDKLFWAFVGSLLGALLAILISGWDERRKRMARLLAAKRELIEALKFNDDRVVQALAYFAKCKRPNYRLDTERITLWIILSSDILSTDLVRAIDWHRYQLDHINQKLDLYHTFIITARAHQGDHFHPCCKGPGKEDLEGLSEHLEEVHKGVSELIRRIEEE